MEHTIEQSIGKKLRNIRQLEERTQAYVAEKCGISRSHLCDIERGRCTPSFKLTAQLLQTLGYEMVFEKSKKVRMML